MRVFHLCVHVVCVGVVFACVYVHVCAADAKPPLSVQLWLPKHQQEESAEGKNKARKTLGMVNVKQIIKYGEKTTALCAEAASADRDWSASLAEED